MNREHPYEKSQLDPPLPPPLSLVPPKPLHLQSPVTALSSPFTCVQKPPLGSAMEEGRGGRGGRGGKGVGGGGAGSREKHSKVSDLISRFEENRWVCLQQQLERFSTGFPTVGELQGGGPDPTRLTHDTP